MARINQSAPGEKRIFKCSGTLGVNVVGLFTQTESISNSRPGVNYGGVVADMQLMTDQNYSSTATCNLLQTCHAAFHPLAAVQSV